MTEYDDDKEKQINLIDLDMPLSMPTTTTQHHHHQQQQQQLLSASQSAPCSLSNILSNRIDSFPSSSSSSSYSSPQSSQTPPASSSDKTSNLLSSMNHNDSDSNSNRIKNSFMFILIKNTIFSNKSIDFFLSIKSIYLLIALNVLLFHMEKFLFLIFLFVSFCFGFCYFNLNSEENKREFDEYLKTRRCKYLNAGGLVKIDSVSELILLDGENDLINSSTSSLYKQQIDQKSLPTTSSSSPIKPSLTGSYLIDDELHKVIDLMIRDYIDSWYKSSISSKEDFSLTSRNTIYNAIRYATTCLKQIDWEHFLMNTLAHNLVIQMRMIKKAKEKRNQIINLRNANNSNLNNSFLNNRESLSGYTINFNMNNNTNTNSSSSNSSSTNTTYNINEKTTTTTTTTSITTTTNNNNNNNNNRNSSNRSSSLILAAKNAANLNETNLIDLFFDLEAEIEKGICRDDISFNSNEKEQEFLQELSEIVCYSLFSTRTFNCLPLRCLFREIFANYLIKYSIERIADPDYINQSILYLLQDQAPLTENFLITLYNSESLDELFEINVKLDEEILRTRSYDKGGHNDQEIKLRLSSLQYVKRRIESCISNLLQSNTTKSTTSHQSTTTTTSSNNNSNASSSAATTAVSNSINSNTNNHQIHQNTQNLSYLTGLTEEEYKSYLFNQNLNNLDFNTVINNETIQHCFIEFMGKQNVQNLISFYLNADMYRQFARKELARCSSESSQQKDINEVRLALKDFAKGLINSYLLSAINFTATSQDDDDQPINISNRVYYKAELTQTVERLENIDCLNEFLLDDLQSKIFLLMKQKYFPDFKTYPEFIKILLKNDLFTKLTLVNNYNNNQPMAQNPQIPQTPTSNKSLSNTTNNTNSLNTLNSIDYDFPLTPNQSSTNLINDLSIDEDSNSLISIEDSQLSSADNLSQYSFELCTSTSESTCSSFSTNQTTNLTNSKFRLSAVISSSGRCNELKTTYAIYIIDVNKINETNGKKEFWQTYRRFNDFYDLHLTIKKKFPNLTQFNLPGKSFRNSLSEEFLEKRRQELNKYLQTLCNYEVLSANPKLIDLLLQFLENKRWENSQTNFKRRVDSILTPMISSVQNIQTSIKNAPDNVIGMVKGISDNILSNTVVDTFTKINSASSPSTSNQQLNQSTNSINSMQSNTLTINSQFSNGSYNNNNVNINSSTSKIQINKNDLVLIEKTILNNDDIQSNNLPVRVVLLLIDEIFDLKEKNQWIRQSLMSIVKTYMKNFKGDSMNKKIKELIADYLREEHLARYIKNFRKRMWPKGFLADTPAERSKNVKEVTKTLAKTKLLAIVSDELRHILGNDTTRRGVFDVFDLFQHKALNKRLLHIIIENLLVNFFQSPSNSNLNSPVGFPSLAQNTFIYAQQQGVQPLANPLSQIIRIHLSRSSRVKQEWKLDSFKQQQQQQQKQNQLNDPNKKSSIVRFEKKSSKSIPSVLSMNSISAAAAATSTLISPISSSSSSSSSSSVSSLNVTPAVLVGGNQSNTTTSTTITKPSIGSTTNSIIRPTSTITTTTASSSSTTFPRSKSLHNEIQC